MSSIFFPLLFFIVQALHKSPLAKISIEIPENKKMFGKEMFEYKNLFVL